MEQKIEGAKRVCGQCGAAAEAEARFCGRCGFDMFAEPQDAHALDREIKTADQGIEGSDIAEPMGLGMAWLINLGAMVLWLGVMLLPSNNPIAMLTLVVHFGLGFVMTRYVMGRLIEFHPVHSTISNVFSAKFWMFIFWPLRMPVLLFKLTVSSSL